MSALPEEPGADAGEHAVRLDADRSRDELERTLDEIEHRLTPAELRRSAARVWAAHRGAVLGVGVGVLLVATGLIVRGVRGGRG